MPQEKTRRKLTPLPRDPAIIERGKVIPLSERVAERVKRTAPRAPQRFRYYVASFEDGPFPVYQPVIVMPDGAEHLLIDGAMAPVWFLSLAHLMAWAEVGAYIRVDAPQDGDPPFAPYDPTMVESQ